MVAWPSTTAAESQLCQTEPGNDALGQSFSDTGPVTNANVVKHLDFGIERAEWRTCYHI